MQVGTGPLHMQALADYVTIVGLPAPRAVYAESIIVFRIEWMLCVIYE